MHRNILHQTTINLCGSIMLCYQLFFAALTAVFAKIGVKDINSNLATAIRTTVILLLT